ncbi:MAG: hypothetical protein AVDCRST_MAG33-1924, partial [uncultured Thermomicrobiales bacterium]
VHPAYRRPYRRRSVGLRGRLRRDPPARRRAGCPLPRLLQVAGGAGRLPRRRDRQPLDGSRDPCPRDLHRPDRSGAVHGLARAAGANRGRPGRPLYRAHRLHADRPVRRFRHRQRDRPARPDLAGGVHCHRRSTDRPPGGRPAPAVQRRSGQRPPVIV